MEEALGNVSFCLFSFLKLESHVKQPAAQLYRRFMMFWFLKVPLTGSFWVREVPFKSDIDVYMVFFTPYGNLFPLLWLF